MHQQALNSPGKWATLPGESLHRHHGKGRFAALHPDFVEPTLGESESQIERAL